MQNDETTATVNLNNVFDIADIVADFPAKFFDKISCREWILKKLHPSGAFCPGCGMPVPEKSLQRFWMSERIKCCHCEKFFTALTDTFCSRWQLDYNEVIEIAVYFHFGMTDKEIAEKLNRSIASVRIWRNKFEAMGKLKHG